MLACTGGVREVSRRKLPARPLKTPNARLVVPDFTVTRRPQTKKLSKRQTCAHPILSVRKANIRQLPAIVPVSPHVFLAPMDVTKRRHL